ncbi:Hypothetical predicted protein [Paramuricea clavata]|uniref:Uncharacterized protein n=1 Tax=Paramuricea clavata TaxID=317549 RepID=A0A6S7IEJ6_PARCT|nr:Hypothetical predicted protein [Paramuricea clavata]
MAKDTTSGSGVLDNILLSTKCDLTQITSETEDLMMHENSPLHDEPEPSSDATANFGPRNVSSPKSNSDNQKIDLLMNDITPVVTTLNKAYEDSLLHESDEDINNSEVSPPKQIKLTTATTESESPIGVVDSLGSEVNTEEKTGPAISEKIAKALDNTGHNKLDCFFTMKNFGKAKYFDLKLQTGSTVVKGIWLQPEKRKQLHDMMKSQKPITLTNEISKKFDITNVVDV